MGDKNLTFVVVILVGNLEPHGKGGGDWNKNGLYVVLIVPCGFTVT